MLHSSAQEVDPKNVPSYAFFDMNQSSGTPYDSDDWQIRTIRALERFWSREIGKDRRHAFQIAHETHVVVPLIIDTERFDAIGNGMIGKGFKLWLPMRIDRPV